MPYDAPPTRIPRGRGSPVPWVGVVVDECLGATGRRRSPSFSAGTCSCVNGVRGRATAASSRIGAWTRWPTCAAPPSAPPAARPGPGRVPRAPGRVVRAVGRGRRECGSAWCFGRLRRGYGQASWNRAGEPRLLNARSAAARGCPWCSRFPAALSNAARAGVGRAARVSARCDEGRSAAATSPRVLAARAAHLGVGGLAGRDRGAPRTRRPDACLLCGRARRRQGDRSGTARRRWSRGSPRRGHRARAAGAPAGRPREARWCDAAARSRPAVSGGRRMAGSAEARSVSGRRGRAIGTSRSTGWPSVRTAAASEPVTSEGRPPSKETMASSSRTTPRSSRWARTRRRCSARSTAVSRSGGNRFPQVRPVNEHTADTPPTMSMSKIDPPCDRWDSIGALRLARSRPEQISTERTKVRPNAHVCCAGACVRV